MADESDFKDQVEVVEEFVFKSLSPRKYKYLFGKIIERSEVEALVQPPFLENATDPETTAQTAVYREQWTATYELLKRHRSLQLIGTYVSNPEGPNCGYKHCYYRLPDQVREVLMQLSGFLEEKASNFTRRQLLRRCLKCQLAIAAESLFILQTSVRQACQIQTHYLRKTVLSIL